MQTFAIICANVCNDAIQAKMNLLYMRAYFNYNFNNYFL
jgi:hypothetical protein